MSRPGGSRWLPSNDSSRIPRCHIILDSEAEIAADGNAETHSFRCAVTACDRMHHSREEWLPTEYAEHDTPEAVWKWIGDHCKRKSRTIVVAHNAGYDLRITKAFSILPTEGWELRAFSLAPGATWATWRRDTATLQIVDSLSWFPTSLENLGRALNLDKPRLPSRDAETTDWLARCMGDVVILREAWMQVVNWLRENDCGNWKPTGAGMGFAAFRHRHLTHRILLHDDSDIRELERRAAWTGRAEPWRFGNLIDGPYEEWDFSLAYATIASESFVPTQLKGPVINPDLDVILNHREGVAYLCNVNITTTTPVLPTSCDGRILWPTGRFQTVVWSNELQLAAEAGASVSVNSAYAYRTAPALQQWAKWALELANDAERRNPASVRILGKHWCRSTIGRFGSRFPQYEPFGESRSGDPQLSGWFDADTLSTGTLLEVGGKAFLALGATDHPHSAPQIMSWIMAESRVRLWAAMEMAGLENVVYVDTDSLIVNRSGGLRLRRAGIDGLRRKAQYNTLDVVGTRRLVENGTLKAAGVPRGAIRLGPSKWSGAAWSSLAADLSTGNAGTVRVVERTVTLTDKDSRRMRMPDGSSQPYRLEMETC